MSDRSILYASFDGVLQPLGFSQVVRVIAAVAKRGFRYHLVSIERIVDVENRPRTAEVRRYLADAGIPWTPIGVDLQGSSLQSAEAFGRVATKALEIASRENIRLFHSRGYQATAVAHLLWRLKGVPYLFDARGCWIDERPDWFGNPAAYAAGKWFERAFYRDAAAVVTLTELHANDVIDGAFGKKDASVVAAIPTCADYTEFTIADRPCSAARESAVPHAVRRRLESKMVLGIVGAMNRSYLAGTTMKLVKYVCDIQQRAHVLVLTQQVGEYTDLVKGSGIAADRATVTSARHEDMAAWLPWIDWGLLLLSDRIAKRGSMPTKLGEFFASGVRPVAYGCNSEMTGWVRRAGSGLVLDTVQEEDLVEASRHIADSQPNIDELRYAREITAPHFSLNAGVERYERLLRRVL